MKKMLRRTISMLLVAALSCGIFAAVPVSAASLKYDKKVTAYLGATSSKYGYMHTYADITIKNCSKKPTSVKASSKNIGITNVGYSKSKKTATITVNSAKAGTYKVTFKVNGKKYTSKVTFKKHTCPASTIKITGVKGNENIASYTKNANTNSKAISVDENVSNAKLKVKIKSGWRLTSYSLTRYSKDGELEKTMVKKSKLKATGTKTYTLGELKTSKEYVLGLDFENKSNGGTVSLTYYIND